MAPDFDALRRMWRCHSLRIASFYKLDYEPPKDMPDLWKKMAKTHSQFSYPGKPPFPTGDTPEDADKYIDECARAFLRYKDQTKKDVVPTRSSWSRFLLLAVIVLVWASVMWHHKKMPFVVAVFLMVVMVVIVAVVAVPTKKKENPTTTSDRKILIYKETSDNDISYITDHLPLRTRFTDDASECDLILSTKFVWGVPGFEPHQTLLTEYGKQPKKVLVFWITDNNDVFEVPPNVYFFRTSLHRRWRNPTEDVLPFVFEPFEEKDFRTLARTAKPIIGFCGAAWPSRKPTLDRFRKDPRFKTLYIEHGHFAAGTREMYMKNILNSHFTICDRGAGNFTMRFWHVLSLGRVPILVEDDMVWPFVQEIDWDRICVRTQDPLDLLERTLAFYHTRPPEETQRLCRETYQRYFSQKNYLDKVLSTILEKL